MRISERELFQHVMMGFMMETDPMLAMRMSFVCRELC